MRLCKRLLARGFKSLCLGTQICANNCISIYLRLFADNTSVTEWRKCFARTEVLTAPRLGALRFTGRDSRTALVLSEPEVAVH